MSNFIDDMVQAFAMHCDSKNLTLEQGITLAEEIGKEFEYAADERSNYLPDDMRDE